MHHIYSDLEPTLSGIEVRPNLIHVVGCRLDQAWDGAIELLDETERRRAARFAFPTDRRRFIGAHAWMRIVIGRCLGCAPETLRFGVGPYGKPHLVDAPVDLRFNLSHAGERALLALTLERDVGVDVEHHRGVDVVELARQFFAEEECAALLALGSSEQQDAFYRCWTRKEAFIKAVGRGLSFALDRFEVSVAVAELPQLLLACRDMPDALERWRVVPLRMETGYTAALAAEAGNWQVVQSDQPAGDGLAGENDV